MHRHVPLHTAQTDFYPRSLPYDEEEIVRLDDIEPSISQDVSQSCDASEINGAISTLYTLLTATPEQYPEQNVNDSNNNVSVYSQINCPAVKDKLAQPENQQFHKSGSQSDGTTCGHFQTRHDHVISSSDSLTMCNDDDLHCNDDSFEVPYCDWPKIQEQCDDVHDNNPMHQVGDAQSQNCCITIPTLSGDCRGHFTALRNTALCTSSFSHSSCSQGNWNAPSYTNNSMSSTVNIDECSKLYYDDKRNSLNSNATVVNHTSFTKTCSNYQDDNQADISFKRKEGGTTPKKRGRPCTYLRDFECTEHGKRGVGNILYQFLLKELRTQQTHIRWEDEQEGTFKFLDTAECSRRWGKMKQKGNMNFEKLSRAMRYYYRDGLMCKVKGLRLVYKINWEVVPNEFRPQATRYFNDW